MSRFDECLAVTLTHEGGWADHPSDPGGATMKGVTIGVFSQFKGRRVSKDELRAISDDYLRTIYRRNYWDKVKGDDLPPGLDLVAFDGAVNSGPAQSAKWLQRALGVKDDGKIGAETIQAARTYEEAVIINNALDRRLAMLRGLKTWPTFGRGWQRRVDDIRNHALAAVTAPAQRPPEAHAQSPSPVAQEAPGGLVASILALLARILGGKKNG